MGSLATAALALGAGLAVVHAPFLFAPGRACVFVRKFPRHEWAAWLLTAVDLFWVSWLLLHMPLGFLEQFKPMVYVLGPIAFFLIVNYVDELLAPRALGGLLLLVPAPLLDAARLHDSPWRLTVAVFAYILVVKGVVLVVSPHMFRRGLAPVAAGGAAARVYGAIGLGLGVFFAALGVIVF